MKERILLTIQDETLLDEAASILLDNAYIVTKTSNLNDMESTLNAMPQDLILIDSSLWINSRPDLLTILDQKYSEASIIHLIPQDDNNALEIILSNGAHNYLSGHLTAKEVLVMVNQAIRYKELTRRYQQMKKEFLEANKNLSNKSKEFQELLAHNNNILESINVGIITVDESFKITSWNPEMSNITGIDSASATGSDLFTILSWLNEEKIATRIKTAIAQGSITELGHLKGNKTDGGEVFADYKISPIKKGETILGAVITVNDITKRVLFKDETEGIQKYFNNLVENASDAIISFDMDGNIATWNKSAQDIFGYTAQEAIGKSWDILASERDRKRLLNLFQFIRKGGVINDFKALMRHKSSELFNIEMGFSIIKDMDEKTYGIATIIKKVAKPNKFITQIIETQRMLTLKTMITGIARNLNTPLATLSTNTMLLLNKSKTKGINEIVSNMEKIEVDAGKIINLAKDFLLYARAPGDKMEAVDIHEILDKSIMFTDFLANTTNIEIRREYNVQDAWIMGHATQLIQALINLFSNAQAAMPDGGILTIQTDTETEKGIETQNEKILCLRIKDTGIGILPENLPHIFEQFFTTRPEGKGYGLGLYAAKSIIEEHDGRIDVESDFNEGTTFSIWLPYKTKPNKDVILTPAN